MMHQALPFVGQQGRFCPLTKAPAVGAASIGHAGGVVKPRTVAGRWARHYASQPCRAGLARSGEFCIGGSAGVAITTGSDALDPCCAMTANGFRAVPDLSAEFGWVDGLRGDAEVHRGKPGFLFTAQGRTVLSSWEHIQDHMVRARGPAAWKDLLHAVAKPCLVLPERPSRFHHPRYALYRLRPGAADTFRIAVLEEHEGTFLAVTAFAKPSFANDHYRAIAANAHLDRCPAFCLRYRDIDPHERVRARPDRVAPCQTTAEDDGCCERQLDCLNPKATRADDVA